MKLAIYSYFRFSKVFCNASYMLYHLSGGLYFYATNLIFFLLSLLSFLQFFTPGKSFIALAILIRIVHATGNALVITATFTFTAIEFHNSVGKIFVSFSNKTFLRRRGISILWLLLGKRLFVPRGNYSYGGFAISI